MTRSPDLADDYPNFIKTLKERVVAVRLSVVRAVSREPIALY